MKKKKFVKIVCIVIACILAIWLVAPVIVLPIFVNRHIDYKGYADKRHPMQDIYTPEEFGLEANEMYLDTEDGYRVWCSEVSAEKPKAVIIYISGIDQPSVTYFYGHSKWMLENGYSTILLELRGHGKSDGDRIEFGHSEVKDVQAVIDYIHRNDCYDGVPIVVQGVSMGGAVAVNSFGAIEDVDALIAMSAYSSVEDVVSDLEGQYHVPEFLRAMQRPFSRLALNLIYGSKAVNTMKPMNQIRKDNHRPCLFIACTGDTNGVPVESTLRFQKNVPDAQVWIRDSWEHFIVKDCDYKNVENDTEYCERILAFLERLDTKDEPSNSQK